MKLIESLPRIHYPGLLVILERRLRSRATALDALEEYKTRGSWVPHGLPLFLSFLPHPSSPSSRVYFSLLLLLLLPPIHRLARSIFLPLPPHRLPLDTCSSPWIRILLGIQVYIYAAVSIKEGSTYLERSPDPRVVYPNSFDDVRRRMCVCVCVCGGYIYTK